MLKSQLKYLKIRKGQAKSEVYCSKRWLNLSLFFFFDNFIYFNYFYIRLMFMLLCNSARILLNVCVIVWWNRNRLFGILGNPNYSLFWQRIDFVFDTFLSLLRFVLFIHSFFGYSFPLNSSMLLLHTWSHIAFSESNNKMTKIYRFFFVESKTKQYQRKNDLIFIDVYRIVNIVFFFLVSAVLCTPLSVMKGTSDRWCVRFFFSSSSVLPLFLSFKWGNTGFCFIVFVAGNVVCLKFKKKK